MSLFGPPPKAASLLDFHGVLSPTAGVRVSPLCLGAMNFGDAWESAMGKCDKETVFEMLDFFHQQGGNFIDTANNYQNEESELWIGEWLTARKNRDEIVLATKFTTCYPNPHTSPRQRKNFAGNSTKSLHVSLSASLKKLQTDYVDLLYVHWWDFSTGIEELMQSLNHMVQRGKVLYLGVSDTPAWVVSKANQYARDHGLRPFSVYQGRWSAASRDFERDILPMARSENMALCPWGALGGGNFTVKEKEASGEKGRNFGPGQTDAQRKVSEKLAAIAQRKDTHITSVALAYVRHKAPFVFPIVGGRKIEHLKSNILALGLELSDAEIDEIDAANEFDVGFPMNFIFGQNYNARAGTKEVGLLAYAGPLTSMPSQKLNKPEIHKLE